jgi:hypothetical protein
MKEIERRQLCYGWLALLLYHHTFIAFSVTPVNIWSIG